MISIYLFQSEDKQILDLRDSTPISTRKYNRKSRIE